MNDTVLTGNNGPLRTITLNRPDKLNAFTAEMHVALRAALDSCRPGTAYLICKILNACGFCTISGT